MVRRKAGASRGANCRLNGAHELLRCQSMNPWIETVLCVIASFAVVWFVWSTPKLRFVWFVGGIAGIVVAFWFGPELYHRACAFIKTLAIPMVIGSLLQFPMTRFLRVGVTTAAALTLCFGGWLEFLAPAISSVRLQHLETLISDDGVCMQATDYTCGPAAAVTLLRRHGFPAEEADIALRAKAGFYTGVDAPMLVAAVVEKFGATGVTADTAMNQTIEQLQQAGECLAVVPYDTFTDHWVAVLEVNKDSVVLADPAKGMRTMGRVEFERTWRHEIMRIHFPAVRR